MIRVWIVVGGKEGKKREVAMRSDGEVSLWSLDQNYTRIGR